MPRTLPWVIKKKSPELSRTTKPATPKPPPSKRAKVASDINDTEQSDTLEDSKTGVPGSVPAQHGRGFHLPLDSSYSASNQGRANSTSPPPEALTER